MHPTRLLRQSRGLELMAKASNVNNDQFDMAKALALPPPTFPSLLSPVAGVFRSAGKNQHKMPIIAAVALQPGQNTAPVQFLVGHAPCQEQKCIKVKAYDLDLARECSTIQT